MVDAELDDATQHADGLVVIAWRTEHARPGKLHGAVPDASDAMTGESESAHASFDHVGLGAGGGASQMLVR